MTRVLGGIAVLLAVAALNSAGANELRERLLAIPLTTELGGDTTRPLATGEAFTFVAANANAATRETFTQGNEIFSRVWQPVVVGSRASLAEDDGLGPVFNAPACADCHERNGRGRAPLSPIDTLQSMLVRISLPGVNDQGGPRPVPGYGDQLQDRAIAGVSPEARPRVDWREVVGQYGDGTPYRLRRPLLEVTEPAFGPLPAETLFSLRVANPLIGLGLLEMVPEETLFALEDPDDLDGDGISGEVNRVYSPRDRATAVGRFGWKANAANLTSQNAAAAIGDMGITTPVFPRDNCEPDQKRCAKAALHEGPEMEAATLRQLNVYIRRLAVPRQRGASRPNVQAGFQVFKQAGCGDCHLPTLITGTDPRAPDLSEQTIHPFTDLLLHDMGAGLADGRADFLADGREWRTAPLWGIGLTAKVSGHTEFLHDGRARSLEEAILWHGGEAHASREFFRNASAERRAQLILFLGSL